MKGEHKICHGDSIGTIRGSLEKIGQDAWETLRGTSGLNVQFHSERTSGEVA